MKALYIAGATLRQTVRDRKALAMMIFMPMLLIGILGTALSPLLGGDGIPLEPFSVAVYDGRGDELGAILIDEVLQGGSFADVIELSRHASPEQVAAAVRGRRSAVGVVIPDGFAAAVFGGSSVRIDVIGDPRRELPTEVVRTIVATYVDQMNALAAVSPVADGLAVHGILSAAPPPVVRGSTGTKPVSSHQYYAAAMAVMTLLITAVGRGRHYLLERRQWTLQRLLISPTSRGAFIAGHFVATVILIYAQFVVLVGATQLVYGVSWGESVGPALAIGFAAASGLSLTVAAFAGSPDAADQLENVGVQLLALVGGSQVPVYMFPPVLRTVARWTPNGRTLQSFLDVMGGLSTGLAGPIAIVTGFGLIALIVAVARLQTVSEV